MEDLNQRSLLGNAFGYNQYDTQVPIAEVAKNTRKTVELLDKIQCNTNSSNPATDYNTNEQFVVSDTNTLTLAANTYHSISYVVLSGTANITVGGTLLSSAPQGYSAEDVATTTLVNSIVITGLSSGTKVAVKTIK